MAEAAPNLLVIRRRYLGDIVLLGSVLRNLRQHWPGAGITVLTEPAYAGVLALNPDVTAALTFPLGSFHWPAFLRRLRRARFTHVLDFDNTDKTALVTRLTGAAVRVTFDRETNRFRHPWIYTASAKVTNAFYTSHHITETYLSLLSPLGVPIGTREVRLFPRPADLTAVAALAGNLPVVPLPNTTGAAAPPNNPQSAIRNPKFKKLLLHPGSRSPFRLWPVERFAAVCDRLQEELGVQVFVVSGPGETALVKQIRAHAKTHLVALEQRLTVGQFAALLTQFDIFFCHDSGPMHIAAAVGTPVVALFGSQNTAIWHPLGEGHTVLQAQLPCSCIGDAAPTPCVKGDSYRSYCVRQIDVDLVFATLRKKLAS
ncbi:MAG: hypothetical protein JWM32_1438 [Verrucomicrobia bacterium]|nr:hypothetical protein [Verrucomicrobiota bacterium]